MAPLEAMASGLPVVCSRAQGLPDIFALGEGHGGILVPCDDPEAIAAGLRSRSSAIRRSPPPSASPGEPVSTTISPSGRGAEPANLSRVENRMMEGGLISVVVCTYNNAEILALTLAHLAAQRGASDVAGTYSLSTTAAPTARGRWCGWMPTMSVPAARHHRAAARHQSGTRRQRASATARVHGSPSSTTTLPARARLDPASRVVHPGEHPDAGAFGGSRPEIRAAGTGLCRSTAMRSRNTSSAMSRSAATGWRRRRSLARRSAVAETDGSTASSSTRPHRPQAHCPVAMSSWDCASPSSSRSGTRPLHPEYAIDARDRTCLSPAHGNYRTQAAAATTSPFSPGAPGEGVVSHALRRAWALSAQGLRTATGTCCGAARPPRPAPVGRIRSPTGCSPW